MKPLHAVCCTPPVNYVPSRATSTSTNAAGRGLHTTSEVRNIVADRGRAVAQETEDIFLMNRLLEVVSSSADPAHVKDIPMRSKLLWAESGVVDSVNGETAHKHDDAPLKTLYDPKIPRRMTDSYCEIVLPFSEEPDLVDRYTNASGGIRTGKLMEHLDSLAGSIAYKHMLGPSATSVGPIEEAGFYLVTAAVDRLDMLGRLDPTRDLRISGMVIYTGKSSMEVSVKMASMGARKDGKDETVLLGRFSMVCLSAETNRGTPVNPLVTATPEEMELRAMGEAIKIRRSSIALQSLDRVPPTKAEADALHQLYLKHGDPEYNPRVVFSSSNTSEPRAGDADESVWMSDSRLEKTQLMFPQVRNLHNKVFGGYLMRLAYELGFASASLFCRGPIRFFSLDGISFAKPVPIGSILRLKSWVLHSASTPDHPVLVHVGVTANVVDVRTGKEETTNEFRFTWSREDGPPLNRTLVPRTYGEAMLWLEGGRALQTGLEIRASRERKSASA